MKKDEQLEQLLGKLLIWGVAVAACVALSGGVWYLGRHGMEAPHYKTFTRELPELMSLRGVLAGIRAGHSLNLIQLGLLLLIATPLARVLASLVVFLRRADYLYCAISGIVLAVLVFGLIFSGHGIV